MTDVIDRAISLWQRTKRRLGRRGAMLTVLAATYILVGLGELLRDPPAVPGAFHLLIPSEVRAALWIGSGVVAAVMAWRRDDVFGWLALYVCPVLRIASYGAAWALWLAGSEHGSSGAWYSAVIHVPFVAIVLICSGWRERRTPNAA